MKDEHIYIYMYSGIHVHTPYFALFIVKIFFMGIKKQILGNLFQLFFHILNKAYCN